jgi:DMSO reductase anchor subunit
MSPEIKLPKPMHKITGPAHKRVWALPAALNFIFGGTAAGFYFLWTLSTHTGIEQSKGAASGGLLAVFLVLAGIAALALESGRPFRACYLLAHWKSSWMSRESAAGVIFIIATIFDIMAPWSIAATIAAGAACVFLLSQGMMVFRCTAVPVWRDPTIPVLFISSGIMSGYGLILFSRYDLMLPQISVPPSIDLIAVLSLAINFLAWCALVRRRRDTAMQAVVQKLLQPAKVAVVMGVGQLLPVIFVCLARPWSSGVTDGIRLIMMVVAAIALLVGNCSQKLWLVRHIQHVCGMQLGSETCK